MANTGITDENALTRLTGTGPDHPVNVVHREWTNLKDKSAATVKNFDEKHTSTLFDFVVDHMQFVPNCKHIYSNEVSTCSCLPDLVTELTDKELMDVAHALVVFGKQTKSEQQIRVMDWIAHDAALEVGLACISPDNQAEAFCSPWNHERDDLQAPFGIFGGIRKAKMDSVFDLDEKEQSSSAWIERKRIQQQQPSPWLHFRSEDVL